MKNKLPLNSVLSESFAIGIKNLVPLIGAYLLWMLTLWIPYLNVGTTIAISTIPLELSKGNIINPLFIFGSRYRQFMGEYMLLVGLMTIAIVIAAFFFVIPAIVIGTAWSLSIFLLLDKQMTPTAALVESNKLTYGYKWKIFGIFAVLGFLVNIVSTIFMAIPYIGAVLSIVVMAVYFPVVWSCWAVIYRNLTAVDVVDTVDAIEE